MGAHNNGDDPGQHPWKFCCCTDQEPKWTEEFLHGPWLVLFFDRDKKLNESIIDGEKI